MLIVPRRTVPHLQDLVSCPESAIFGGCPFFVNFMDNDGTLERKREREEEKVNKNCWRWYKSCLQRVKKDSNLWGKKVQLSEKMQCSHALF